jgi:uncharacterized protein HemY
MNLMDALANSYYCQGKYDDAEKCYRENLHLRKIHTFQNNSNGTIITMNNLASILTHVGKHDEAEVLYQESLKNRRQELGNSHPQTVISISNLGVHYFNQAKYQNAETLYLECLDICQQHYRNTKPHHDILYNLGLLYLKNENFQKSAEMFKQLLDNNSDDDESIKQKYLKFYTHSNNMMK